MVLLLLKDVQNFPSLNILLMPVSSYPKINYRKWNFNCLEGLKTKLNTFYNMDIVTERIKY